MTAWCVRVLLIGCLMMIAACGSTQNDSLRFGLASALFTLDPRFATDATSARINRLLYRQLEEFDEKQQPVPGLADWQRLSPTRNRIHLRAGDGRDIQDGS